MSTHPATLTYLSHISTPFSGLDCFVNHELWGSQLHAIVSEEYNKIPFPVRVVELQHVIYQREIRMKKCQILDHVFQIRGFTSHNAKKVINATSPNKTSERFIRAKEITSAKSGIQIGTKRNLLNGFIMINPILTNIIYVIRLWLDPQEWQFMILKR
jgi:hypothetical protein